MPDFKLYTSPLSPYGHRVEMCLHEKNIPFERIYVDLGNKPDWFVKLSPLSKAPILQIDNQVLFDSIAICEYLEEAFGEIALHPKDPVQKALNRGWMDFSNGLISSVFQLANTQNKEAFEAKISEIQDKINHFENNLPTTKFFNGEKISIIDICMLSALVPLALIESEFAIDINDDEGIFFDYSNNLLSNEKLNQIIPDNYDEIFKGYLTKRNSYLLQSNSKNS
ncbi:MAG: glutathione S-transferase family protein [Alphaproteobacteria bacterium]